MLFVHCQKAKEEQQQGMHCLTCAHVAQHGPTLNHELDPLVSKGRNSTTGKVRYLPKNDPNAQELGHLMLTKTFFPSFRSTLRRW